MIGICYRGNLITLWRLVASSVAGAECSGVLVILATMMVVVDITWL